MVEALRGPTICLNMIVKNEAHIVHEVIEAVSPHIHYWVIVDTGSDDGTQDLIRAQMSELGIPGEIHDRPWRDFGSNRTEALELARGHCDYIWVMDADDTLVGSVDFSGISADGYLMPVQYGESTVWRFQLFRSDAAWRYEGAIHEYAVCEPPAALERLDGDYHIVGRYLGARSRDPRYRELDRDALLAEIERDPANSHAALMLAITYKMLGDCASARIWCERCAALPGLPEDIYWSMFLRAEMMAQQGDPWAEVQDAYLKAWEYRPSRAEALHAIAYHYRISERYELGYLFAARAAQIPMTTDLSFVDAAIYRWRALDEQAVCASWTDRQYEAVAIWRKLLTRNDIPEADWQRIQGNRDFVATQLVETSSATYSPELTQRRPPGRRDAEITVSLIATTDRRLAEWTLNSFLRCCVDLTQNERFILVDAGLSPTDRKSLTESYPFLEFIEGDTSDLNGVRDKIGGRYWLHLWEGWRFFTEEPLLTRLVAVFQSEPSVYQVGVNVNDAACLGPQVPARSSAKTTNGGWRYVLGDETTRGPAMFKMDRLNRVLGLGGEPSMREQTATLDEVLCLYAGAQT